MKKIYLATLMALALITVFNAMPVQATFAQGVFKAPWLVAGKTINMGTVTFAIDGEDLVVTYSTAGGWELTETHLYLGATPPTKGNPGKFPYKHEDLGAVTSDQYVIPLADLGVGCGDTLYMAAHAVVQKWTGECWWEETGWAGYSCPTAVPFRKGWGVYVSAPIPCNP